jgi:penicillin-binding protein 1A
MPLKLTCPSCGHPNRITEPYPMPGAEVMCQGCGIGMSVSYPTCVMKQLRDRGKRFVEEAPSTPIRPTRPGPATPPPPSARAAEPPTSAETSVDATVAAGVAPRRIDLAAIPSGPEAPRRRPPPMTMPSFATSDLEDDDAPPPSFNAFRRPASDRGLDDAPTHAAPFPERTTQARPPRAVDTTRSPRATDGGEPTAPLPPPAPAPGRAAGGAARHAAGPERAPKAAASPAAERPPKAKRERPAKAEPEPGRRRRRDEPAPKPRRSFLWRWTRRIGCLGLVLGTVGAVAGAGGAWAAYTHSHGQLPSVEALEVYRPPTVTEVYDRDGTLMGELYEQRRYVVPLDGIPKHVRDAFIYAEDAKFYEHDGVDYAGLARATFNEVTGGEKRQGASTITMQVTRNFLLTRDKTYERKIKEILLAQRIESVYDKDRILWLYLNELYLGSGAYGVEAAARVYFGKRVGDLSVAEAALIAGLAPAPSTYSPHRAYDKARTRQLYVLEQMWTKGAIDEATYKGARDEAIRIVREENPFQTLAPHFTEHVRRHLMDRYGFDAVYKDGLRVVTTMDLPVQRAAQESIVRNVHEVDQRMGFRRAGLRTLASDTEIAAFRAEREGELRALGQFEADAALRGPLPERSTLVRGRVYQGAVLAVDAKWLRVGVGAHEVIVPIGLARWAYEPNSRMSWRNRSATAFDVEVRGWEDGVEKGGTLLRKGDVIEVKLAAASSARPEGDDAEAVTKAVKGTPAESTALPVAYLWQTPQVEAAVMSYDLNTGAVRAMVGGADFARSEFNRATQAYRQVGSTFKPIVYAAAIDSGRLTSASIVPDVRGASYTTEAGFVWKPDNYGDEYLGNITLRKALAMSKNTCTIKVLESMDPGMNDDVLYTFARKLGIGGPPTHLLPEGHVALPSNDKLCPWTRETPDSTICMDRNPPKDPDISNTRHRQLMKPEDVYMCRACDMSMGLGSASLTMEELLRAYSAFATDGRLIQPYYIEQVLDRDGKVLEKHEPAEFAQVVRPEVASITNWLLQQVVRAGTGNPAYQALKINLAGKTGTTQDYKDTWFVGFSPDVITAAWVGFDEPRSLGVSSTGGRTALPIWIDTMRVAAPPERDRPFKMYGDLEWAIIDETRGTRVTSGGLAYPFIRDTAPSSSGVAAGELTVEDFTEL